MDRNPTAATDSLHSGPERQTRGVRSPSPAKATALIDSIVIRESGRRVCTLEQAVAVHEDEIEYGTGKGTIAVQ